MDLADLREHIGPGPSDDVLERLLDAALQAIVERFGPASESLTETLVPVGSLVYLSRRAESVTSVRDGLTLLDYTEYELVGGGKRLRRLNDAGDPMNWVGRVEIEYAPYGDDAERDRVTIALVNLDLNAQPGLSGSTVGSWATLQSNNSAWNYRKEREALLASLRPVTVGVW